MKKIIKVISVFMVLNIFLIPLANFAPGNQIKTVQAAEGVVDIRFYNAMVSLIGITAAGIAAMSPSFSIPEVDMIQLKDQFAQSLESDAAKKTAWMNAQTDYLAGGIAKTMSATELAKIGISDIYSELKEYLNSNIIDNSNADEGTVYTSTSGDFIIETTVYNMAKYIGYRSYNYQVTSNLEGANSVCRTTEETHSNMVGDLLICNILIKDASGNSRGQFMLKEYKFKPFIQVAYYGACGSFLQNEAMKYGINCLDKFSTISKINGSVSYRNGDIIDKTDTNIKVIPTIPWLDPSIPAGTIVTPVISAPYAGVVPIDVPMTVPIDPPVDEPVDPPVEENITGTVAAILAGLTPIAGFLEYILAGQVSLTDTIEAGITGVIDGIGDIAGTLTGGITSSLTDIQSSISTLTAPATETINLDPVKNIPKVLFTKFPFSIPWDLYNVYNLMATDNRSPPEFLLGIQMSKSTTLSSLGAGDINMEVKLENYEQIAGIIRVGELLLFVLGLIFATKKLIWG